jgi:hypothetical protein
MEISMTTPVTSAPASPPAPVPPVTPKPGWRTSEFWVTLFTILGGTAAAVAKPNTGLAIGGAAATAVAYNISRALVKTSSSP